MINTPLVEAIFEIRWELERQENKPPMDTNYKIFLGRFFDRISKDYPHHVTLPSSNMPDEISAYIIQHQFRIDKDKWPLIQVGQGITTLNYTESYEWDDFKERAKGLIRTLFELYPDSKKLKINSLILRYINGIKFNYERDDVITFLKKIHCDAKMSEQFFTVTGAQKESKGFNFIFVHPSIHPVGQIITHYGRGMLKNNDAIIWEMGVQSEGMNTPNIQNDVMKWLNEAHDIPHNWYKSIKEEIGRE